MKRIRVVGTCIVAALACGAIAASSAYAGEYGECLKASKVGGKFTGAYLDNACEKAASSEQVAEGKLNRFSWQAVAPARRSFTAKIAKAGFRWGAREVACKHSTASGEILGWQKTKEVITFEGCYLGKGYQRENCWSEAFPETSATITTNTLDSYLIDHGTKGPGGREPKEGEVWNEYESGERQPYLAEFECRSEEEFRVSGTNSAVLAPGKMVAKDKQTFSEPAGEQDLVEEASPNHGANWYNPELTIETAVYALQFKSKVEIRPCNEPGAVPEGKELPACEHEELPLPWAG